MFKTTQRMLQGVSPTTPQKSKFLSSASKMKYPVIVHESEYGYDSHCPVLQGCHSQGDTLEEALKNIKDAIKTYLEMIAEESKGIIYEVEVAA